MVKQRRIPEWTMVVAALLIVVLARAAISVARNWQDESGGGTVSGNADPTTGERGAVYGPPVVVGRIEDDAITEASGLVASRALAGVLWTHNDSGGRPVLYCIRLRGTSCGSVTLTGVDPDDWEGLAIAPGNAGWDLYVADIGDNPRRRDEVLVHRVPEPRTVGTDASVDPETLVLSYPDGAHDAETLLVHPETGDLYIITKEFSSRSIVFKASAPVEANTTLQRVGSITIDAFLSDRTGGDISPDGTRVILSTYASGYELVLPPGASFDDIWTQQPHRLEIGEREQGEAVTYSADGASLFSTSEGRNPPLYRIDRR